MQKNRDDLWLKIQNNKFQQGVFTNWLQDLSDINNKKQLMHSSKSNLQSQELDQTFYEINDQETEDFKQKNRIKWQKDLKEQIQKELNKEKKTRDREHEKDENMERRFHQNKNCDKKSQATFIKFFQPADLVIFALLTKEVQLYEMIWNGMNLKFNIVQSCLLDSIPIALEVQTHKTNGNLLLILATKHAKSEDKTEICVFQLDQQFKITESYRFVWGKEIISSLFYTHSSGLIVSSYDGLIEQFDPVVLYHSRWNSQQQDNQKQIINCGSITAVGYSQKFDVLAFGGVRGVINSIDLTTKKFNGASKAYNHEIKMIIFYDKQNLMVSVSVCGEIQVYDSQQMIHFQTIKIGSKMVQNQISCTYFDQNRGLLILGTTKLFNYVLKVNDDVKVRIDQQNSIARDYMRDFFSLIKDKIDEQEITHQTSYKQKMTGADFLSQCMEEDYLKVQKQKPKMVIGSSQSNLLMMEISIEHDSIFILDSDLLMRQWHLDNYQIPFRSYLMETKGSYKKAETDTKDFPRLNLPLNSSCRGQIAYCDQKQSHLVVVMENGDIQINQFYTGDLLYNRPYPKLQGLKVETDINAISFFYPPRQFWIAMGGSNGKISMFTQPVFQKGKKFLQQLDSTDSHYSQIVSMDINSSNQLVTAAQDNTLIFWNSFTGVMSKKIKLPETAASVLDGEIIKHIKFAFPSQSDLLLVILNTGNVVIFETQTEKALRISDAELAQRNQQSRLIKQISRQNLSKQPNQYHFYKISENSVIDFQDGYLVSISDDRHYFQEENQDGINNELPGPQIGHVHKISYKQKKTLKKIQRHESLKDLQDYIKTGVASAYMQEQQNAVKITEQCTFKVGKETSKRLEGQGVSSIRMNVQKRICLLGNTFGFIQIFNLLTGEPIQQLAAPL